MYSLATVSSLNVDQEWRDWGLPPLGSVGLLGFSGFFLLVLCGSFVNPAILVLLGSSLSASCAAVIGPSGATCPDILWWDGREAAEGILSCVF